MTTHSFRSLTVRSTYAGPGDVVAGATGWWGLRSYTSASVGSNVVRLRESGGNTEQDFATIAGGGLNIAAITAFKGANNLFVTKLYDQSGFGNDAVQATAGQQPAFTLAGFGAQPSMTFTAASLQFLQVASTYNRGTTLTFSTVIQPSDAGGSHSMTGQSSGTGTLELRVNFTKLDMLAQSVVDFGAGPTVMTNGTKYTTGGTYNGANWVTYLNGAVEFSGANATGFTATNFVQLGAASAVSEYWSGIEQEWGDWGSVLNGTQMANLSANQRTFWGF